MSNARAVQRAFSSLGILWVGFSISGRIGRMGRIRWRSFICGLCWVCEMKRPLVKVREVQGAGACKLQMSGVVLYL